MRLIRTVLQTANIGLSRQFQWSQVINTSSGLHLVLIDTSNEHGSNIRWCRRSYAASASFEALEPKKARGRVSKDVRKSMVENYVNKYREMNAGKFPTAFVAMKNVGGSYYVIREILQELKYNSKMSPSDTKDTSSEKSAIKKDENEISTDIGEIHQARELGELITPISKVDKLDSSSKSSKPDELPRPSVSLETVGSKDIDTQSHHLTDESKSSQHFGSENNKQATVCNDERELYRSKSQAEAQASTEVSESEFPIVQDADHKTKSSVWQNLKSFANGILSRWKNS